MMVRLTECLDSYAVEHLKPERCDTRRFVFAQKKLEAFFGADRDIATLRFKDGRAYRAHRLAEGATDSTIRRELGALRAALKHACREERVAAVPEIDMPPEGAARERWFTEAEITKILAQSMSAEARLWLIIAMATGARLSAITGLTWDRVDLERGFIDFREPGRKETKKRRVKVAIASYLRPTLEAIPLDERHGRLIKCGNIGKQVKRVLARAGIEEKGVGCHSFRRTFVTWALLNGEPLARVAGAIGDNPSTIEKHYLRVFPHHTGGAVEAATTPPRG